MDAAFWHARWEQQQIGFHQPQINPFLQRYWPSLGLSSDSPVLVPLCGKSRDLDWLAGAGHPVLGCELSQIAVEAFFAEQGVKPEQTPYPHGTIYHSHGLRIWCGDFFKLTPEQIGPVAAVYDRAALIALPPEMRPAYAAQLVRLMPAHCQLLLVTTCYSGTLSGPPFSIDDAEVAALFHGPCAIEHLETRDTLADSPGLIKRGATSLTESVWRITRLAS